MSSYAVGDWEQFPTGYSCYAGARLFYENKFGVTIGQAPRVPEWTGNCRQPGACLIWLDNLPDPDAWERISIAEGRAPQLYDLIIYEPNTRTANGVYGHAAVFDHIEVGPDGKERFYVMDDNWVARYTKAPMPHTVGMPMYGWYRLRKLGQQPPATEPPVTPPVTPPPSNAVPAPGCVAGGTYCGGDKAVGDSNTLYQCKGDGTATPVFACNHGCEVQPGRNDVCRCVPYSFYCGGDQIVGDGSTLYRCSASGTSASVYKYCSNGCNVTPGANDSCW